MKQNAIVLKEQTIDFNKIYLTSLDAISSAGERLAKTKTGSD